MPLYIGDFTTAAILFEQIIIKDRNAIYFRSSDFKMRKYYTVGGDVLWYIQLGIGDPSTLLQYALKGIFHRSSLGPEI